MEIVRIDWDEHHLRKNVDKHGIGFREREQVFFNYPLVLKGGEGGRQEEMRHYALGRSNASKLLFVVYALRKGLVRPISFRPMSKKERRIYLKYEEDTEVQE